MARSLQVLTPLVLALCLSVGLRSQGNPVAYVYDELGRLVQVTDPPGNSAIYRYDPVGNLIAIERQASNAVSVSSFSPASGSIGTTVTIYGTGFNATPSSNTVTFNGVTATVSSSTVTKIVTTVPATATTGPIGVTNTGSGGSTTTSAPFIVTSTGPPTITGFTPAAGTAPTTLEIDGTNFDTVLSNNAAKLNATFLTLTSATTTELSTTVPPTATSGRIKVSTVHGTGTAGTDFWVPPAGFTTGQLEFKGRMNGFGDANSVQVVIGTGGNVGLVLFDGAAGQRVTVKMSAGTSGNTTVKAIAPNSVTMGTIITVGGAGFIDVLTLPMTGSYTVLVDPPSSSTGSMTVTAYDVPADDTGTITAGGSPVTVTISVPGQKGSRTFSASSGQRISLKMTGGIGGLGSCTAVTIKKPDGSTQASYACVSTTGGYIDRQDLTAAGTYTIAVDPVGQPTGTMTLTLYDVPSDITGSVTINGSALPIAISAPGQNANVTFAGTSAQSVRVLVTGPGGFPPKCATITLLRQDNSTVVGSTNGCGSSITLPATTLPATETYNVLLNPTDTATGNYTLRVVSP
jgi:YD repeat-containing protein